MEQGWDKRQANQVRGTGLDNNIVDINENYINYTNYNPKLVHKVDGLAVADTGTTRLYLTLDSPWDNK